MSYKSIQTEETIFPDVDDTATEEDAEGQNQETESSISRRAVSSRKREFCMSVEGWAWHGKRNFIS